MIIKGAVGLSSKKLIKLCHFEALVFLSLRLACYYIVYLLCITTFYIIGKLNTILALIPTKGCIISLTVAENEMN